MNAMTGCERFYESGKNGIISNPFFTRQTNSVTGDRFIVYPWASVCIAVDTFLPASEIIELKYKLSKLAMVVPV